MAATSFLALDDSGLKKYLAEIKRFPILDAQDEYILAKRWRDYGDKGAAHKLVTSHLRLVAKIAMGYRGYGLPIAEIISEGNIGLMQAVKKFEPDKGFRLTTYAIWWIRASIQDYIMRSWSMVKIGTTASQKKLFFKLRKAKSQIQILDDADLKSEQVNALSTNLGVSSQDIVDMNARLSGDASLNSLVDASSEFQDFLVDDKDSQETVIIDREEKNDRQRALQQAMDVLKPREREIFIARRLQDPPATLEDLSHHYSISRERVRQIELSAFEKIRNGVQAILAQLQNPINRQKRLPQENRLLLEKPN